MSGMSVRRRAKVAKLFHQQKGLCYYCDRPLLLAKATFGQNLPDNFATADHIVPKAQGGTLGNDNLVAACHACNNERGDADARLFYLQKQGMLA